jgi:hypothetical protein
LDKKTIFCEIEFMSEFPGKIDVFEKRFGNIAIEKGYITLDKLTTALEIQIQEEIDKGERRLVGQILLEMDAITSDQIKQVLSVLFEDENELRQH